MNIRMRNVTVHAADNGGCAGGTVKGLWVWASGTVQVEGARIAAAAACGSGTAMYLQPLNGNLDVTLNNAESTATGTTLASSLQYSDYGGSAQIDVLQSVLSGSTEAVHSSGAGMNIAGSKLVGPIIHNGAGALTSCELL